MEFRRQYRAHRFTPGARVTLDQANHIIGEMRAQGYVLTLRQLYYQFVSRNWVPNTEREYKRLGRIVTRAREAGEMDWYAIEDRGRTCHEPYCEEDPATVVDGIELGLVYDQWARQDVGLEVWVEKSALEGVVSGPCRKFHVSYMACKGYLSTSEAWRAGLRFRNVLRSGRRPILIHLADHDPSGLNMTTDNENRIRLFAEKHDVEVRRIALNMEQVEEYGPPPNPAKETDSRSKEYVAKFGPHSWELDALKPSVLEKLIEDTILGYLDPDTWDDMMALQEEARRPLAALGKNWPAVEQFLFDKGLVE